MNIIHTDYNFPCNFDSIKIPAIPGAWWIVEFDFIIRFETLKGIEFKSTTVSYCLTALPALIVTAAAALMVVADWLGTLGRYVRKKISQNCRHYTVCTITHALGNNISSQTWKKCKKNKTVAVLCRFVWLNSISECATANHLELTRQIELFSMVELKKIQTIKRLFFLKSTILWNFHVGNEWF